jgi:hypothetical protein
MKPVILTKTFLSLISSKETVLRLWLHGEKIVMAALLVSVLLDGKFPETNTQTAVIFCLKFLSHSVSFPSLRYVVTFG